MRDASRLVPSVGVLAAVAMIGVVERLDSAEARKPVPASRAAIPRAPDGRPNLQGTWAFATITPLQRPDEYKTREKLTLEEVAQLEKHAVDNQFVDTPPPKGQTGHYNMLWLDAGTRVISTHRTSLLVEPPDGRMPPLTAAGLERQKRQDVLQDEAARPEDLTSWDRCILGYNAGPPMIGGGYNAYVQIFQTADRLALLNEMNHDVRLIPVGDHPALTKRLRQWRGVSKGRWEGDTFIVETSRFRPEGTGTLRLKGLGNTPDENLRLTERFSLMDADTLLYEYTVDDPTVWTRSWSVSQTMWRTDQPVYEYACHEGNHAMRGILAGAREMERQKADPSRSTRPQ